MTSFAFSAVQFVETCPSWKQAVRLACQPLEKQGLISQAYAQAIIASTEENGPWYILTPGFAMPHARPEEGVLSHETHLSLLRIRGNVMFEGHDAVGLLILLAAGNGADHLAKIQQLTQWLDEEQRLEKLLAVNNEQALLHAIH
ncbi:MAG: PTS sugar transporter subunit IIA [Scandinavium sp.]|uniref:PTS sugar transporter subunit IIA n=1 Tax=Scandinavium sp. TaxID=2830653 RepID=UPI003F2AC4AB